MRYYYIPNVNTYIRHDTRTQIFESRWARTKNSWQTAGGLYKRVYSEFLTDEYRIGYLAVLLTFGRDA